MRLLYISGKTKTWTEGNHAWFDVKLRKDTSITIYWGDGGSSFVSAPYHKDSWLRVEHLYKNPKVVSPYIIEFFSDVSESILGLVDGLWETNAQELVVENSPSMMMLTIHQLERMCLLGSPNLSYLDCESFRGESLELNYLTELTQLHCNSSEMHVLDISHCTKIEVLGLYGCHNLRCLRINNKAPLAKVCVEFCQNLSPPSLKWLENKVSENGGEIVDWLSGEYLSTGFMDSKK